MKVLFNFTSHWLIHKSTINLTPFLHTNRVPNTGGLRIYDRSSVYGGEVNARKYLPINTFCNYFSG